MNKRGLSTIIVTLILIALALVAIGIFWIVVRNMINQQTSGISFEKFTVSMDIEQVYSPGGNNVAVQVKRNPGKGEITGVKFIFYNETGNEVVSGNASLSELETRTFTFALNMNVAGITKVSIAPIFESAETGSIADTYELTEMTSGTCSPSSCSSLGYTCGTWSNGTCSGSLFCGNCSSGYGCVSGTCQLGTCTPTNCTSLGYQCGTWANGTCSGSLFCGNCLSGYNCNASGRCVANCVPKTSCNSGECGTWSNGTCSGILNCGGCGTGYSCISGTCQAITGLCSNLVLLMHFDADISPTSDSSGNNNNGTVNGATWTSSGRFGGAFSYDGINDYISRADSGLSSNFPGKDGTADTDFTFSAWINLRRLVVSQMIVAKSMPSDPGPKMFTLPINVSVFGANYNQSIGNIQLLVDTWYNIIGVHDSVNNELRLYLNGVLDISTNNPKPSNDGINTNALDFRIGARNDALLFLNGTIDDVAVWNRALNSSEISSIYSSGSAISC